MRKNIIGLFMGCLAVAVLPACDIGNDDAEQGDSTSGEGSGDEFGDMTEGGDTDGGCMDHDEDGVCDHEDLCVENLGTHCLLFGAENAGILKDYVVQNEGELGAMHKADLQFGVTLDIAELLGDPEQCSTVGSGETARVYEAYVENLAIVSADEDAQAYIDENIRPNFDMEGAVAQIRWAMPPEEGMSEEQPAGPMFDFLVRETEAPAYTLRINDFSYSPSCANMTMGDTLAGDNAIFWIDWSDVDSLKDRVQGEGGKYVLRPHGG